MSEILIEFMQNLGIFGIILSIIINVILSFLPVPSFFITAINITVYGLVGGFLVSLVGESVAAYVSFIVFRKGFKQISRSKINQFPRFMKIIDAEPKEAFQLILVFRMFPYVPSGVITYFAAIGQIKSFSFTISSTIGKIPAMIIEVGLVFYALTLPLNQLLAIVSIIGVGYIIYKIYKKDKKDKNE